MLSLIQAIAIYSEETEPSQTCAVVSDSQLNAGPPEMTTALETVPVSQVDSSAIPIANGIAKEAKVGFHAESFFEKWR